MITTKHRNKNTIIMKNNRTYILPFVLLFAYIFISINMYADDSQDLYPNGNAESKASVISNSDPDVEELIFFEDFGTSDKDVNYGRSEYPYMPIQSFKFGTPYPESDNYDLCAIDNDHYAVVAPAVNTTGVDSPSNIWWGSGDNGIGNNNTMNVYAGSWMETLELEFSFDWDSSDIEVKKSVDNDKPAIGSNVTFSIEVINRGLMFAQDITVNDLLPSGYEYVSHSAPMGTEVTIPDIGSNDPEIWTDEETTYNPETGVWTVHDIPYDPDDLSKNKRVLTITAKVLKSGEYNKTAEGYPEVEESDPNHDNNRSTIVVTPVNTTNAVDDFAETDQNTPVSGNVLNNDYDLEGHTQTVSDPGTHQTEKGGSITIDADGSYTYTPPTSFSGLDQFEYEVCDDGESRACDKAFLLIGVNICAEKVVGESFASGGEWVEDGKIRSFSFTQPGTNYGFVLDIYKLDNSFNMEINGTKIAVNEIEFQPQDPELTTETLDTNVEFADGTQYTAKYWTPDNQPNIFQMEGDAENPLVRVIISPRGSVTLWGSKVSKGPLFPLVLTENIEGQNRFNNITWNTTETNNITVTQHVVGATVMIGYGYGQNIAFCGETVNYWMGGTPDEENAWNVPSNWTANFVPGPGQDVEFATVNNYGAPAVADLHLDDFPQDDTDGRIIGKLVNNSDKDLVITTGNQLTIDGEVVAKTVQNDGLFGEGTILVKSTNVTTNENEPTGTLLFNPDNNPNGVQAEVEFYNTAYDCADCGFYTRSWQYFGVPVQQSGITPPFTSDNEVNEWNEPTNGDKWITPNHPLTAFTGYQVTRNTTDEPDHTNAVHLFNGSLNITDASVALIRTDNVNYSGVNLIGNSYTAAIPISTDAIDIPTGVESTIYLFNTGTRDEWRKLNGSSTVGGVAGGQYLSVPINTAGEGNLPDRIPSMHTFMILVPEGSSGGNVGINYNQLVKNTTVNRGDGTRIVTRSAGTSTETGASSSIPTLVMDVIGEQSADRAWLFAKEGTTHGFDNGWDGRKMAESGIAQLYVAGTDESKLQVATMPTMDNVSLGFAAETDGKYTFEFSLSEHMNSAGLFLHDQVTGASVELSNGVSYTFEASKGETVSRFRLTQSGVFGAIGDEALISVEQNSDGKIVIKNNSGNAVTAFISNSSGATLQSVDIDPNSEAELDNIGVGLYVVRLQNAVLNDARRLIVK